MNNENMLKIAIGMGLNAQISMNSDYILVIAEGLTSNCKFNPTEGDIMRWLYDNIGVFSTCDHLLVEYMQQTDSEKPSYHLKENLLSIVLQVIESDE